MTFKLLSLEELVLLRALLEKKLPMSSMVLNIVDLSLSIKGEYLPDEGTVDIYSYHGVPSNEQNLFIVAFLKPKLMGSYSTVFLPDELEISDELIQSFSNLYDWSSSTIFAAITGAFLTHLEKLIQEKGGSIYKGPASDMYLSIEDALKLDLKRPDMEEEFEVDKLQPENASMVNTHWKYGSDEELGIVTSSIRHLVGAVGVFKKKNGDSAATNDSRSNSNLVSFVVLLRLGTFNALHTLEEYRGKGLGRWTMEAASKIVAEKGLIPLCEIEEYNVPSRRLMEKIGFKVAQNVFWIKYTPPKKTEES